MGPRGPQGLSKMPRGPQGLKKIDGGKFWKIRILGPEVSTIFEISIFRFLAPNSQKIPRPNFLKLNFPKKSRPNFFYPRGPWGMFNNPWGPQGPIKDTFKNKVKLGFIYKSLYKPMPCTSIFSKNI